MKSLVIARPFLFAVLVLSALPLVAATHRSRASVPPPDPSVSEFSTASGATVTGTVTSISGTTITIGGAIRIDASSAKITAERNNSATLATIVPGVRIDVLLSSSDVAAGAALPAQMIIVHVEAELAINGTVQSVDVPNRRFVVLGITINVDADTTFSALYPTFAPIRSLSDLAPGQAVSVEARSAAGILATRVVIDAPLRLTVVSFRGTIKSIGASSWVITDTKNVDTTVNINAQTKIIGEPKLGATVQVLASVDSAHVYTAIAISAEPVPVSGTVHLNGIVKSIAATQWVIGGPGLSPDYQVLVNSQTTITGDPKVGDSVQVTGERNSSGVLVASLIVKDIR